ncbi:hypothetical protein EVAR_12949_1 [Eumeta japonica]|uniref:Uncharacterized protein n=1 Tax=Eumeta variegata TaxID=151549 RepID=A0A4C1TWY3_EUMVA|nr:hypothetical protein EVAR_12949_1 [Eumeta japonica]
MGRETRANRESGQNKERDVERMKERENENESKSKVEVNRGKRSGLISGIVLRSELRIVTLRDPSSGSFRNRRRRVRKGQRANESRRPQRSEAFAGKLV